LYELSRYISKHPPHMAAALVVVWHKPNQLKCIFKLGNCSWLWLQLAIKTPALPTNVMIQ